MIKKYRHLLKSIKPIYSLYKYVQYLSSLKPRISKTAILKKRSLIVIGKNVDIWDYVIIKTNENNVIIGNNSQINPFTVIYGGSGVVIGENVMIAPHVMIAGGNHEYREFSKPMRFSGSYSLGKIIIEDDVWIGANTVITDAVHIGKGSIVGAGSVVTKDVKPYDVVAGIPAKVLFNRKDKFYK